jgi:hypothetical protein
MKNGNALRHKLVSVKSQPNTIGFLMKGPERMANSGIQELMSLVNSGCPRSIFTGLRKHRDVEGAHDGSSIGTRSVPVTGIGVKTSKPYSKKIPLPLSSWMRQTSKGTLSTGMKTDLS